ncbi:MAG: DoxX family protein [Stackebrandtia sp.]
MNALSDTATTTRPSKGLNITLWILQVLLAVFFLVAAGGPKLFGEATAVEMFDDIGLGDWFRYFTGAVEVAGAIGLVIPRLSGLAAIGLTLVMVGAVITSLFVLNAGLLTLSPAFLLVLFAFIAWGRRGQTLALLDRSES